MKHLFTLILFTLLNNLAFSQYIEEFDYDQPGTDSGEFIDVFLPTGSNTSDYQIVLYNGSGGAIYGTYNLTSFTCVSITGGQICTYNFPTDGLQNGAPDGVVLKNSSTNTVIQALSYEGAFTGSDGTSFTNIGVSESNSAPNLSCQYNPNNMMWSNQTPNSGAVLPIELLWFDTKVVNKFSYLSFATASETNNDFFTIERSADGTSFDAIGEIKGAGNSNTTLNYEFTDEKPIAGANYYRIKQTDYDGKFSYTDIKSVRHNMYGNLSITPRTTEGRLQITTDAEDYTLDVYNVAGQQVKSYPSLSLDQTISIDELTAGLYYIKVNVGGQVETTKIVKL